MEGEKTIRWQTSEPPMSDRREIAEEMWIVRLIIEERTEQAAEGQSRLSEVGRSGPMDFRWPSERIIEAEIGACPSKPFKASSGRQFLRV